MKTLALDLATVTGFAVLANGTITHGAQAFLAKSDDEHPGARYARFQRWLRTRIAEDKPTVIAVESAGYFKSLPAQSICVGFRGILLSTAAYYDIPLFEVSPSRLKKWTTGKGNAKKEDMIRAARVKWPAERFVDNNACDAFLLLRYWMAESGA